MTEHAITVPISMLLPLAGAVVAGLGWLFNLHGKVQRLEADLSTNRTAVGGVTSEISTTVRRLDLCEHTHREFAAQYRRDQLRVAQDLQLVGRIERLQRLQERGAVIPLTDLEET